MSRLEVCKECGKEIKDRRRKNFCSDDCRNRAKKKAGRGKKLSPRNDGRTKKALTGEQMWCGHYRQLISRDVCSRRQKRMGIAEGGQILDYYCRTTCKGTALAPATAEQIEKRREMLWRIARERGYRLIGDDS